MDESYVAMLMDKHKISDNLFIYSPNDIIIGNYDEKNNTFVTKDGKSYSSVESIISISDQVSSAFSSPLNYLKLKSTYSHTNLSDDFFELCKQYKNDYMDSFLIVKKDKNSDTIYIQEQFLNLDDEEDMFFDNFSIDNNNGFGDVDVSFYDDLSLEELYEMKNKLSNLSEQMSNKLTIINEKINKISNDGNNINVNHTSHLSKKYRKRERKQQMYEELFASSIYMDVPTYIKSKTGADIFDIENIGNKIKKTVISQNEAIDRILIEILKMSLSDSKNNGILLTGSTGVGKTEILTQMAKYINRPIKIIDTTQLSAAGYVGRSIEEYLWELYIDCNRDLKQAERAIIVFDEIDKKGSEKKDDISGKAVLNSLLKFIDGTNYKAAENMQVERPGSYVNINTNNMLIIGAGAFSDVYKNIDKNIGFNKEVIINNIEPTTDDFIEKAMLPDEFMGRFPVFIHLNDLSIDDLKTILVKSDKSPLKEQIEIFKKIGINLKYEDSYIEEVAKKAYLKKTGARGLKAIVADSTYRAFEFALKYVEKYDTLLLTRETVINHDKLEMYNSGSLLSDNKVNKKVKN